jgi:hypothetical protein
MKGKIPQRQGFRAWNIGGQHMYIEGTEVPD